MKTKILLSTLFASLLFAANLSAQNPNLAWAKQMGGTENDAGNSITTDANGNIYTTGYFSGTVDFDPGVATTKLTSAGYLDIFIQKLDANGNLIWVKQMGGEEEDRGQSITTDANGNVYTTGAFLNTVDFDPGAGTSNLTTAGNFDIFIQKLDANGNLIWVKQMGGTGSDYGYSITTDANGNVYTTGYFSGTVDFDPGAGTTNLTSAGNIDIFIQKLDANGNLLWVKQMGGIGNDSGNTITTDANGNVYTTGHFQVIVDFDPGVGTTNLTSAGLSDIFIQKLDANGNLLWVKRIGGSNEDGASSIITDANGNVYTTGYFQSTVDFDPGVGTTNLMSAGLTDIFIQKLDANGNLLWAKQMGGTGADFGESITPDSNGNVYTTGVFSSTVDFDPGVGTTNLMSAGLTDIFIQKLDANGNLLWVKQMGGNSYDFAFSITTHANGNVYTTGYFMGTADFDPGVGTTNLTAAGGYDIFIQKMSQSIVGLSENVFTNNLYIYPNPVSYQIQIRNENAKGEFRIYDIHGKIMLTETLTGPNQTINIRLLKPGIYIWQMENRQGKIEIQ